MKMISSKSNKQNYMWRSIEEHTNMDDLPDLVIRPAQTLLKMAAWILAFIK